MTRPIVHEVVGGRCRVCGEIAEWLEADPARGTVVYLDAVIVDTDAAPIGEGSLI